MIIYQASKSQFLDHAFRYDIEEIVLRQFRDVTGHGVGDSEVNAWKHSLLEMAKVLQDEEIPADVGVAVEYQLPQSSKRIDFVIVGEDHTGLAKILIVELKQWSKSRRSDKDAIIWARRGAGGEREGPHPCYQAWSYAAYLQDFNEAVQDGAMKLQPCAYLHNHRRDGEIDHPHYGEYLSRAPLFLAHERNKLQAFIREHVRYGDRRGALYAVENGRIRPSKMLMDSVEGLLQGRPEFVLIDEQKVIYETALQAATRPSRRKQVVIIQGGPGTGKSVVAINLLGALISRGLNSRYVSKNAAPRAVYEAKLTGRFTKTRISNLFSGSGAFVDTAVDAFDTLIVDEAHRLNEKSGLYKNLGENQVREIIRSSRCTIFFVDDDQRVTIHDIGQSEELRRCAEEFNAEVIELELLSQFRCNGADGYLAWLDDILEIRETANRFLDDQEFDFRVIDSPSELHELIELKNRANNRARVVAGYCWKWPSKRDPGAWDITLPEFNYRRQWNLDKDGSLWIVAKESVAQVGCIHTCQGLELDYVGVIIGPDMTLRSGKIATDVSQRASSDQSIKGLKQLHNRDPEKARALGDAIIKNTYRTLMTRGMKGCFVYCTDALLAQHLKSRIRQHSAGALTDTHGQSTVDRSGADASENVFPLALVPAADRMQNVATVPVIDLRIAAGAFSEAQSLEAYADKWVALPDWVRPQPNLFVAQVVGESMNRRIRNGSWCLFRAKPEGTREGKVVVAQLRSLADPETGGQYTIKLYSSEKITSDDGEWAHRRITLRPDSNQSGFAPLVFDQSDSDSDLAIVAEMLMVLAEPKT